MTGSLIPFPDQTEIGVNGNLLVGGKLYTFVPGTDDPKTTYSDPELTATNTQPIVFDSIGRANVYGNGAFDFLLQDADGNEIYRRQTASFITGADISPFMLTVNAAEDATAAQNALGIPALEAQWAAGISLLPGPTGPTGVQGPTGVTGPQGSTGSGSYNRQVFNGAQTYTWTNPGVGTWIIITSIGAGGASSDSGDAITGGGGGGSYVSFMFPLANLNGASVTGVIGGGGQFVLGGITGNNGGVSTFGPYFTHNGGSGGGLNGPGAGGYIALLDYNTFNIVTLNFASSNPGTIPLDAYGNVYYASPNAPTNGYSRGLTPSGPVTAFIGGSGGGDASNGVFPGGGGGANGGNGADGQIIITCF